MSRTLRLAGTTICLLVVSMMAVPANVQAEDEKLTLIGVLEEKDEGRQIMAHGIIYFVEGYIPAEFVGKVVSVTGTIERGQAGEIYLIVEEYSEPNFYRENLSK